MALSFLPKACAGVDVPRIDFVQAFLETISKAQVKLSQLFNWQGGQDGKQYMELLGVDQVETGYSHNGLGELAK